jgi:simple sugar transport system ATP-binding protein
VAAAVRDVVKVYPGAVALSRVTVEFSTGEIHALLGENGAGKSTLVKMLAGLIHPDSGTVEAWGQPLRLSSPRAARARGIGVVHQSGSLIATMTVEENLRLCSAANTPGGQSTFQLDCPGHRLVRDLSQRERQWIEVCRLLAQNARILVLDEPTAALSPQESELLFRELRRLAEAGYAVIVVSHKLAELVTHADRFTVLRRGRVAARLTQGEATAARLVELLNGPGAAKRQAMGLCTEATAARTPLVCLDGVSTFAGRSGKIPLSGLSLELCRGEVVGIVGRPGSGAENVLALLRGSSAAITGGSVKWLGGAERQERQGPRAVGYVPANRLVEGGIAGMTVADNLALRRRHLLGGPRMTRRAERRRNFAAELIRRYDIRPADDAAHLDMLSGGNVQKVLLAREMDYAEELLLVENPTAGLDVSTSEFVLSALAKKASDGACVVVHSDDLDELLAVADRVVVISGGRCVAELAGESLTREAVGAALGGATSFADARAPFQSARARGAVASCAD